MKGLVYTSKALAPFTASDLELLAADAASRNTLAGITGYLYFDKGRFMQYIEGDAEAIDALMERIRRDQRHAVQREVADNELKERRFPTWHMYWVKQGALVQIRLEHLLYDFMQMKTSPPSNFDFLIPQVWSLVDKITELQTKYRS